MFLLLSLWDSGLRLRHEGETNYCVRAEVIVGLVNWESLVVDR